MKRYAFTLIAVLLVAGQAWGQSWLDGWTYRQAITIPDAKVTGSLTDYPVLLDLTGRGLSGKARTDRADLRFTAADGTTVLDHHLMRTNPTAAWTWFNRPEAIYSATYNKTWIGYLDNDGQQAIVEYNHTAKTRVDTVITTTTYAIDDHNNPALFLRSDGKLLACWTKHNGPGLYCAVSTNAGDSTAWGSVTTLTPGSGTSYTYAQLCYLSDEGTSGRLYWIYRNATVGTVWQWIYSDNDGDTWSDPTTILTGNYPYPECVSNGVDTIHVMTSNHARYGSTIVGHVYYDGAWKESDGTAAGDLPYDIETGDGTAIYTASGTDTVWTSDIQLDASGNPHVLFYVYPSDDATNQDLYYGRWTGSAWATVKVCDEGGGVDPTNNPYYPGVSVLDPDDVTTLYVAKEESGVYEIQKWTTADAGASWAKDSDVTSASSETNMRPLLAENRPTPDDPYVAWMRGPYSHYITFQTILCSAGTDISAPRYADFARVAVPSLGGSDVEIYMYYGNATAQDTQSLADTWAGVDGIVSVLHFVSHVDWAANRVFDSSGNSNHATITDANGDWDDSTFLFPGFYLRKNGTGGTGVNAGFRNLASQDEVTSLTVTSWEAIDTNEQAIASNWSTTMAAMMLRIEPSNSSIEAFVCREANTQEGGTVGTFNVSKSATHQFVQVFDHDAASNLDIAVRVDKVEAAYTCTSSAALDASNSTRWRVGSMDGTNDPLKGIVQCHILATSILSKDWTDTHYDNVTDAEFVTFGAEEQIDTGTLKAHHGMMAM